MKEFYKSDKMKVLIFINYRKWEILLNQHKDGENYHLKNQNELIIINKYIYILEI